MHPTNHVVLALDGPGSASCRKPNAPNMFVWFETSYFYGLDGKNLVLRSDHCGHKEIQPRRCNRREKIQREEPDILEGKDRERSETPAPSLR